MSYAVKVFSKTDLQNGFECEKKMSGKDRLRFFVVSYILVYNQREEHLSILSN